MKQRSFETKEGEKRTVVEVEVDEIGPSLRYAKVNKVAHSGGGGGYGSSGSGSDDPWGSAPATGSGVGDEPPF